MLDDHPTLWAVAFFLLIALLVYLAYLPVKVARDRDHPNKDAILVCAVLGAFFWPLWVVAIIWAHTAPKRSAPRRYSPPPKRPAGYVGSQVLDMPAGYAPETEPDLDVELPPAVATGNYGPGKYCVSGVDRESKMDTSMVVHAESATNAKVKGELEGIVVTNVEFQGRQ